MNKEIKEKWIKALRSGEYEQRRGGLFSKISKEDKGGYCCLGVLNDIYNKDRGIDKPITGGWLKTEISEEIGIKWEQQTRLSSMNDGNNCIPYNFLQIADYIEQNL